MSKKIHVKLHKTLINSVLKLRHIVTQLLQLCYFSPFLDKNRIFASK